MKLPVTERPDDDLLEDDARLDLWFNQRLREQARAAGKAGNMRHKYDLIDKAAAQALLPDYG